MSNYCCCLLFIKQALGAVNIAATGGELPTTVRVTTAPARKLKHKLQDQPSQRRGRSKQPPARHRSLSMTGLQRGLNQRIVPVSKNPHKRPKPLLPSRSASHSKPPAIETAQAPSTMVESRPEPHDEHSFDANPVPRSTISLMDKTEDGESFTRPSTIAAAVSESHSVDSEETRQSHSLFPSVLRGGVRNAVSEKVVFY